MVGRPSDRDPVNWTSVASAMTTTQITWNPSKELEAPARHRRRAASRWKRRRSCSSRTARAARRSSSVGGRSIGSPGSAGSVGRAASARSSRDPGIPSTAGGVRRLGHLMAHSSARASRHLSDGRDAERASRHSSDVGDAERTSRHSSDVRDASDIVDASTDAPRTTWAPHDGGAHEESVTQAARALSAAPARRTSAT